MCITWGCFRIILLLPALLVVDIPLYSLDVFLCCHLEQPHQWGQSLHSEPLIIPEMLHNDLVSWDWPGPLCDGGPAYHNLTFPVPKENMKSRYLLIAGVPYIKVSLLAAAEWFSLTELIATTIMPLRYSQLLLCLKSYFSTQKSDILMSGSVSGSTEA